MTTFTTITNALVAVGAKPFASTVQALRDNPLAIQEGDPTAPKVQPNAMRRITLLSGAAAANQTFTGLGDYGGVEFEVHARSTLGSASEVQFSFSTDGGATWSTATTIGAQIPNAVASVYSGSFDFASGVINTISSLPASAPGRTTSTLAGASLAINAVRFTTTSASLTCTAIIRPVGASQ